MANFNVESLGTDFLADKAGDNWQEVYDSISKGLMPKSTELTREEVQEANIVTDWIFQERRNAEQRAKRSSGRIRLRRLNRSEYLNCLRDLFHISEDVLRAHEAEVKEDSTFAGFDRLSESLFIDDTLWNNYYDVSSKMWDRDLFGPKPNTTKIRAYARDITWGKDHTLDSARFDYRLLLPEDGRSLGAPPFPVTLPTGASVFIQRDGGIEYLTGGTRTNNSMATPLIGRHPFGRPWSAGGGAWSDDIYAFLGKLLRDEKSEPGRYRFKLRAGAFKGRGEHAVHDVVVTYQFGHVGSQDMASCVIDAPLDRPREYAFEMTLHPPKGKGVATNTFTWNGTPFPEPNKKGHAGLILINPELSRFKKDATTSAKALHAEFNKAKASGDKARIAHADETLTNEYERVRADARELVQTLAQAKKPLYVYNPEINIQDIPRLWIEWWEVEGPIVEWPSRGRKRLFFDGDGEKRAIDSQYIRDIFSRFLPRAYRRPVTPAEVDTIVSWVAKVQKENNLSGLEAVKAGVKAVLCSPDFLFLCEYGGDSDGSRLLNDYELASRLSFFLWSSMPDDELFRLAADNRLHEPDVLKEQVQRMLRDAKAAAFTTNFTGQWLRVRDFGKTITDVSQYKSYTYELKRASRQEPYEFFKEILEKNLSILTFVDSDFVMINETLAKHYGIEGVTGDHFRKVKIEPRHHRGGGLGMAGVLTYLTDGIRTLPVRRAAFVLDALWNDPPKPPPPDAGELPRLKGNETVRQRLQKHKEVMMCASCHARIDPLGMALENYDAIGAWRDRQTGEWMKGDSSAPLLDVSGVLPDKSRKESEWRRFANLQEFKKALLDEKDRFIHGFTEKMLTYALSRPISRTMDRELIENIIHTASRDNYGLQSLVQAIVASEAFRRK